MATCKDCIHYDVCYKKPDHFDDLSVNGGCKDFADKPHFIKLPCKVGDIVYQLDNIVDYELCYECENYYEGGMGDYPSCEKTHSVFRCTNCIKIVVTVASEEFILRYFYDFGKTVFLTPEEVEQALKERSENDA